MATGTGTVWISFDNDYLSTAFCHERGLRKKVCSLKSDPYLYTMQVNGVIAKMYYCLISGRNFGSHTEDEKDRIVRPNF